MLGQKSQQHLCLQDRCDGSQCRHTPRYKLKVLLCPVVGSNQFVFVYVDLFGKLRIWWLISLLSCLVGIDKFSQHTDLFVLSRPLRINMKNGLVWKKRFTLIFIVWRHISSPPSSHLVTKHTSPALRDVICERSPTQQIRALQCQFHCITTSYGTAVSISLHYNNLRYWNVDFITSLQIMLLQCQLHCITITNSIAM